MGETRDIGANIIILNNGYPSPSTWRDDKGAFCLLVGPMNDHFYYISSEKSFIYPAKDFSDPQSRVISKEEIPWNDIEKFVIVCNELINNHKKLGIPPFIKWY